MRSRGLIVTEMMTQWLMVGFSRVLQVCPVMKLGRSVCHGDGVGWVGGGTGVLEVGWGVGLGGCTGKSCCTLLHVRLPDLAVESDS